MEKEVYMEISYNVILSQVFPGVDVANPLIDILGILIAVFR